MESELLSSLEKSDLIQEEWFIALRAVLKKPLSFFLENRKEFRAASADKTFPSELKEDQKFISNDYTSLFTLVKIYRIIFMSF